MNLYQHSNNYAISLVCVREMVDLKILESDWLIPFWPISQEQDFSEIKDLCRNRANIVNFNYRINSVKIIDQIFL